MRFHNLTIAQASEGGRRIGRGRVWQRCQHLSADLRAAPKPHMLMFPCCVLQQRIIAAATELNLRIPGALLVEQPNHSGFARVYRQSV